MPDLNPIAILVAAVASFAVSAIWYMLLGDQMARLQARWRGGAQVREQSQGRTAVIILATRLVVATVVAVIGDLADVTGLVEAAGFGLLLWIGFALTQWVSSIAGEGVPFRLAAIHATDWLLLLVVISVIVGIWQ